MASSAVITFDTESPQVTFESALVPTPGTMEVGYSVDETSDIQATSDVGDLTIGPDKFTISNLPEGVNAVTLTIEATDDVDNQADIIHIGSVLIQTFRRPLKMDFD